MEKPVAQKDAGSLDTFEEEMLAIIWRVKVPNGFEAPGTTSLTCGNEEAHQDQTQAGTQQSVRGQRFVTTTTATATVGTNCRATNGYTTATSTATVATNGSITTATTIAATNGF